MTKNLGKWKFEMRKGIVYSIDAVFAIYIVLISVTTFIALFNYTGDFGEQDLELARIARDVYNIKSVPGAGKLPDDIGLGSNCTSNEFTGHAFVIESVDGAPAFGDYIVCVNED